MKSLTTRTTCRGTKMIERYIPYGRANAVTRTQLMIRTGLPDRKVRREIEKARAAAREAGVNEDNFMCCERGASFGYGNLVSDMRSLAIMRETGAPVVFDATHSVQLPGGLGNCSGGQRQFIPALARAAAAVGIDAIFMEVHPNPDKALSDGANSLPLEDAEQLLMKVKQIHDIA